jgi:hypothetical protein
MSNGLPMLKMSSLTLLGAMSALALGLVTPASAAYFGCDRAYRHCGSAYAGSESASPVTRDFAARKRPRVIIYPRRIYPGPYAVRQCRDWLVTEYRVSGPVIVPQMRCWWE